MLNAYDIFGYQPLTVPKIHYICVTHLFYGDPSFSFSQQDFN